MEQALMLSTRAHINGDSSHQASQSKERAAHRGLLEPPEVSGTEAALWRKKTTAVSNSAAASKTLSRRPRTANATYKDSSGQLCPETGFLCLQHV